MEAFRQYTPMDPEAEGTQAALIMHFVNQAAPDIRKKLQKLERLGEEYPGFSNSGRKALQYSRDPRGRGDQWPADLDATATGI